MNCGQTERSDRAGLHRKAITDADIILLLVDHTPFRGIPGSQIPQKWIIDTKGVWR